MKGEQETCCVLLVPELLPEVKMSARSRFWPGRWSLYSRVSVIDGVSLVGPLVGSNPLGADDFLLVP